MIIIGSDHAGYELKKSVIAHLKETNVEFVEAGCMDGESCDYPLVAKEVCEKITDGTVNKAILICGTGIGISMAANKIKGIRAALCTDAYTAKYTRLHNDANVLAVGERVVGPGLFIEIADAFINTPFSGDERHIRRVNKIKAMEEKNFK